MVMGQLQHEATRHIFAEVKDPHQRALEVPPTAHLDGLGLTLPATACFVQSVRREGTPFASQTNVVRPRIIERQ